MLSQQINESIAEISARRLAIIIQIQIQNWPNEMTISDIRTRAGKNRFESIRIDSVWRIEWVVFDSVPFDYTIYISNITMFDNWQPIL